MSQLSPCYQGKRVKQDNKIMSGIANHLRSKNPDASLDILGPMCRDALVANPVLKIGKAVSLLPDRGGLKPMPTYSRKEAQKTEKRKTGSYSRKEAQKTQKGGRETLLFDRRGLLRNAARRRADSCARKG